MRKKIDILRIHIEKNEISKAISLAAKFPHLGIIKVEVERAHMAITNPRFCRQIKKDPEKLIIDGWNAIIRQYKK